MPESVLSRAHPAPEPAPTPASTPAPDRELDIRGDTCPMTFVRTRLALDRMAPGQVLLVRLRGEEPRRGVPRTAAGLGHDVLAVLDGPDGETKVLLRKG